jgi:hypothetical protein
VLIESILAGLACENRCSTPKAAHAAEAEICNRVPEMLLGIYLNDHLAAATSARELARRAAASNRRSDYGPFLDELANEIDSDRDDLLAIMRRLGVGVDRIKLLSGWGAEKLGRLKLNGRLLGYSPLSRLVELELLELGVHGKLALWRSLQRLELDELTRSDLELPRLVSRAEHQLEQLESQRLRAVAEALT